MKKFKEFKEKLAKKGGFTLVELIVVIAILGILAAVAVPTYTGYVKRAHEAADTQILSSVATAVSGVRAGNGGSVTKITVTHDGAVTVNGTLTEDEAKEVRALLGVDGTGTTVTVSGISTQSEWATAVMSGGKWTFNYA